MEPLGEWCRANNEAYQGIFIDEHHLGQCNEIESRVTEDTSTYLRIGTK